VIAMPKAVRMRNLYDEKQERAGFAALKPPLQFLFVGVIRACFARLTRSWSLRSGGMSSFAFPPNFCHPVVENDENRSSLFAAEAKARPPDLPLSAFS